MTDRVGLGWRPELAAGILAHLDEIDVIEVIADDYFDSATGARAIKTLAAQRPVVRRVLTSAPCSDVVEMTVIIGIGPRTRAIAARLERAGHDHGRSGLGSRWVCTAVEAA